MSGTFVAKFLPFTASNKHFHISNKDDTNIKDKAKIQYQWQVPKMRNASIVKSFYLKTIKKTIKNIHK